MSFKPPPKLPGLLEKVIRFKALQHKQGKVLLHGIPVLLTLYFICIYLQKLLEKLYGKIPAASILHHLGYTQAKQGIKLINKRFGYAITITDKRKLLEFHEGQAEIIGLGRFKISKFDFDKNIFILRGTSTLACEYLKFFGLQKYPVDHFLRGGLVAAIESLTNKKMFCYESKCIAKGNPFCEFVIRPIKAWNKKELKEQKIKELPDMEKLGAKCLHGLF